MTVTSQAAAPTSSRELVKEELDRLLQRFEFEEGAVLIQVPQVPLDLLDGLVARNRGYFAYPPQGLLYLSASFRALRIPTRVIDLNYVVLREAQREDANVDRAWREALDEVFDQFKNPFVCVSLMFNPTYPYFKAVCEHIQQRKPWVCLAAGGVDASADPEKLLNDRLVHLVFSHEGEEPLVQFYAYLRCERKELPVNISFVDSQGVIAHTSMLPGSPLGVEITNEYEKIPITQYHEVGSLSNFSRMNGVEVPFATLLSRRGCRARCSFCSVRNFNGLGVRVRHSERVVAEMEFLYHEYGIRHFDWLDDDLLFEPKEALELFSEMRRRLPDITWAANNGLIASAITRDLMEAMEQSGCIGFKVGLESGNEEILHKVHKPTTLAKFRSFAQMAQNYPKIFVAVNFILGLPEETFGQLLDSFREAIRARLDWNNFYMYQPLKNTELYVAYGGLSDSYVEMEHGKEAQGPELEKPRDVGFNPVRGGSFKGYQIEEGVLSGYEIIELDPRFVPGRAQLKEIWFTFNYVANFIQMPAVHTDSEIRLRNGIRWMEVLSQAYPEDAAMTCVLYYLKRRLSETPARELENIRMAARAKFEKSPYWRFRDRQFSFSAFLDGVVPVLDSCCQQFLNGVDL